MGCWILDAAEAEGRRKERLRILEEIEIRRKEEDELQKIIELLQKKKVEYEMKREAQKLYLFYLVDEGDIELDYLVSLYRLSKEELEKEYRDYQLT
ncbi:MAG: hypothetical protein KBT48_07325 [Firmicutes bacterium]|nr:hypothetical protein [Bacillota bacterium]